MCWKPVRSIAFIEIYLLDIGIAKVPGGKNLQRKRARSEVS
jgi:hypothetical protein